jgi:hypothetical protein
MIGYVNVFSWMALLTLLLVPLVLLLRPAPAVAPQRADAHVE